MHPEQGEIYFQVDGELAGRLPCSIEIVPDALTILAPRQVEAREKKFEES